TRHGQAHRRAVPQALRAGDDIRRDAVLFDPEPLPAGAAPAGLDFVTDEQAPEFAYDSGDDLEIFLGRSDESSHALDRFRDEGGDAARSRGPDHLIQIPCAAHVAGWVFETERAAVTVGV